MFHTLDEADVRGKGVLVRVDLNVPVENGKVADRMHDAIGDDLSAVVIPTDLPRTSVRHSNELVWRSPMDGSHSLLFRSDSSLALRCRKGAIHPITRSPRRRSRAAAATRRDRAPWRSER